MKSQLQRFEEKINKTDTCWIWTGCVLQTGYGQVYWDKKKQPAHRVSYLIYKGEIPASLVIDHLCRVKNCVNPNHLEAVTYSENTKRGFVVNHTRRLLNGFCKHGHLLSKENAYEWNYDTKDGNTTLLCRECNCIRQERFKKRKHQLTTNS